jgi:hypothetical protein
MFPLVYPRVKEGGKGLESIVESGLLTVEREPPMIAEN